MIIEQVAIDFRCRGCNMIRRIDAKLSQTVGKQAPEGWVVKRNVVNCPRCADDPEAVSVKERADEKREEVRKLRMPTADVTSLESPVTAALSPLVSDTCTRCNAQIGETESWRPDPEVAGFAKAHRQCLLSWAEKKAQAAAQGMIPEDPM